MRLRVVHTTGFEYGGKVLASYNQARLTPQTRPGQIVAHHRVEVDPAPWSQVYRDWFGNEVTAFEVLDPHRSMTVRSISTVHTDRRAAPGPVLSWDEMGRAQSQDRWTEYLAIPELVAPAPDLVLAARELAMLSPTPGDAAREICRLVHREMEYVPGSTDATTGARQAWEQRAGVCQDMAHVALGALRSVGVPARYVSGYLHPRKEAVVGETVAGESHAWVEWWDGGWRGYDPTNDLEPGDRWVVAAVGRDYFDVRPLHGVFTGAGTSAMFVEVEVTRLE
ncbi:transglutaminase family protein [Nocardioides yefusunii]|uniref:Transglutaminase domain-containing protein n=1 Tax=Nocardioides yefusunii TaxID=2500546 RepID=A0ABW1QWP6_9ACTN|nr:transglutaminase family protein [Nocardioides yefusunii]